MTLSRRNLLKGAVAAAGGVLLDAPRLGALWTPDRELVVPAHREDILVAEAVPTYGHPFADANAAHFDTDVIAAHCMEVRHEVETFNITTFDSRVVRRGQWPVSTYITLLLDGRTDQLAVMRFIQRLQDGERLTFRV